MDYKLIEQRLDELNLDGYKHIKNNEWELPDKLKVWLEERDFSKLGSGAFSSVYQSETENFVVKINNGHIDKGYLNFVDFCEQNKSNPHLPKMGKIKKYDNWYILFIEKIKEIPEYMEEFFDDNCLKEIILKIGNISDEELMEFISEKTYHYSIDKKYNKQILDIAITIKTFMEQYSLSHRKLDLHAGNIMMRRNTFVITDPVL